MATFSSVVCAWVSVFMSMEVHKKKIWLELDQFSLLLSRNQRRPPSLTTFSIFPNSQTNHRDNFLLFGLSILIQNFTFLALRRAHQLKLCFWALPSEELFTLWTQRCNSLFMTSTNPETETSQCLTQVRHPILRRYKHVSPCLLRMPMSHAVNCWVSAGPLVNDVIFNKSAHIHTQMRYTLFYPIYSFQF